MNSSPWVDPENCRTCGECCKSFETAYPIKDKEYSLLTSEVARFQALAGLSQHLSTRVEGNTIWLIFNFPCKHLIEEEGVFSCAIYDSPDRPAICQHYPYKGTMSCPHKRSTAVRP